MRFNFKKRRRFCFHFSSRIRLSTAATWPSMSSYQRRCLFIALLLISQGQIVRGHGSLYSNRKYIISFFWLIDNWNWISLDKDMMLRCTLKLMEWTCLWKKLSILKIHILGSISNLSLYFISEKFFSRCPSGLVRISFWQYHASSTEQCSSGLASESGLLSCGAHPNPGS